MLGSLPPAASCSTQLSSGMQPATSCAWWQVRRARWAEPEAAPEQAAAAELAAILDAVAVMALLRVCGVAQLV